MQSLREFVERASRGAETIFRRTGQLRPMWHAFTRDGDELIFPTASPDKDVEVLMVRALFSLRDVVRYAFIDEAWIIDASGDNATPDMIAEAKRAAITGVEKSPLRREVVMFSAEDHAEGQLLARRAIIRPDHGRPKLGPLQIDPQGGIMAGRMIGLLPQPSVGQWH